jgi:hypothetical protein
MELKIKVQNRLAVITEGLYFINHVYKMDLETILKPAPKAIKGVQRRISSSTSGRPIAVTK